MRNTFLLLVVSCILLVKAFSQPQMDGNYFIPPDHKKYSANLKEIITEINIDNEYFHYNFDGLFYNSFYIELGTPLHTAVYSQSDMSLKDNGFFYLDTINPKSETIVLMGGDIFLPLFDLYYYTSVKSESFIDPYDEYKKASKSYTPKTVMDGVIIGHYEYYFWDDGIEFIKAWSELSETIGGEKITYSADRMKTPFYAGVEVYLRLLNSALFWAEGDPGPGIGGTIDVEFKRKSDHIMLLNGAVDLNRLHLYKANNRLKRIRVEAVDGTFSIEHSFEDYVAFHKVQFPNETSGVKIKILDVYKGERWDDTCVTAIYLQQEHFRPREEYEAMIERFVREQGIDKLIEEYENSKKK